MNNARKYLDENNQPVRQGVYLAKGIWGNEEGKIDVYRHPKKGLCVFSEDYGGQTEPGVNDTTDCHISVQFTGLEFISWIGNIQGVGNS